MTVKEVIKQLKNVSSGWILRFHSHRFSILIDKETNEYINLYRGEFKDPFAYDILPDLLEHHKNYKGIQRNL